MILSIRKIGKSAAGNETEEGGGGGGGGLGIHVVQPNRKRKSQNLKYSIGGSEKAELLLQARQRRRHGGIPGVANVDGCLAQLTIIRQ